MNENITDFIETAVALLLFIAALTNGLVIVMDQSAWLHTAINANQSKERHVFESWNETDRSEEQDIETGSSIIARMAIHVEHPYELLIDGVRFEMPLSYLPAYDLSFIALDHNYRVNVERNNQGFITRMNYERE